MKGVVDILRIARSQPRRRDFFFLELLIALSILATLNILAARASAAPIYQAKMTQLLDLGRVLKYEAVIHYSNTGKWPSADTILSGSTSTPRSFRVQHVQSSHGSFNLVTDPAFGGGRDGEIVRWNLSFILRQPKEGDIFTWDCGYAGDEHSRLTAHVPNLTSVPRDYLPPICRQ